MPPRIGHSKIASLLLALPASFSGATASRPAVIAVCWTLLFGWLALTPLLAQEAKPAGEAAESKLPPVVVETVVERTVNTGYRVVGTVRPAKSSTIGTATDGRVEAFLVNAGQAVQSGQALAQLRTGTLRIELAAAQAELELVRQQLAELSNGARPEEIAEAEAIAAGAEAAMENSRVQLKRLQSLSATGAATAVDIDNARERATTTRFAYAASTAALERIRNGPRPEQIAQRRAQVDLQTQRVLLIQDRLEKHTIRAPFDGFVSEEFTEVGAWVSGGDPIVTVMKLDEVEVQAPVTADYATKLSLGDTIRVEFPQLPQKLFTGQVDRIVPQADPRARTYPVIIGLKNEMRQGVPLLLSGMLARMDLPAGASRRLPLVPKDALVLNESERVVYVIETERRDSTAGIARKQSVSLGVAVGEWIQVSGKVEAGQQVVVVGNERLNDGMKVRLQRRSTGSIPAETKATAQSQNAQESAAEG
ncbi:MAG: efflux RND transporter periplasmic adaptor subunit [Pirellulaceae bacterium]